VAIVDSWVDQMRLGARKARHLHVRELIIIGIGIVSRLSLNGVACVGCTMPKRAANLTG
jgi:hypothetical protein